ncbi:hypothetical protein ACWDKQ_18150 [Saccharopolyspora sp. NPDC000995]
MAAPLGPGGFGLAFWLTAIAYFAGHRVSNSRLKRAMKVPNAEREA